MNLDEYLEEIQVDYDPHLAIKAMLQEGEYAWEHHHVFSKKDQQRLKYVIEMLKLIGRG